MTQAFLIATEHGFGKRTALAAYPLRNRGGKGVIAIRVIEKERRAGERRYREA